MINPHVKMVTPERRTLVETAGTYYPFGLSAVHNVFQEFQRQEFHQHNATEVLFLGCGDLKNVIYSTFNYPFPLNLHINDICPHILARNVLMLSIFSSDDFHPEDDLRGHVSYLWDLWNNCFWPVSTCNRFAKDVERLLMENRLPSHISIPNDNHLECLKKIWKSWLNNLNMPMELTRRERIDILSRKWNNCLNKSNLPYSTNRSFADGMHLAISALEYRIEMSLFSQEMKVKMLFEIQRYFETGNCAGTSDPLIYANPTFHKPINGKTWFLNDSTTPFEGFLPLTVAELDNKDGMIGRYCQNVMKKWLIHYKQRKETIQFFFHLGDAINFCYENRAQTYDVIDSSSLSDGVGLVNILNATSQRITENSILLTETVHWSTWKRNVEQYVEETLCAPLSMLPTLYGVRLLTRVELGSETPPRHGEFYPLLTRLVWQKAPDFGSIPIGLSPFLQGCLDKLKKRCFPPTSKFVSDGHRCGMLAYSPLTFHYVLCDLAQRSGADWTESAQLNVSPVYQEAFSFFRAWKQRDLVHVWRFDFCSDWKDRFSMIDGLISQFHSPPLRMILVPKDDFYDRLQDIASDNLCETVPDMHYIDNLDVQVEQTPAGDVVQLSVFFLVNNPQLIDTHYSIIVDVLNGKTLFAAGSLANCTKTAVRLTHPYSSDIASRTIPSQNNIEVESFIETKEQYDINLKMTDQTLFTEVALTPDVQLTCESTHGMNVLLNGIHTFKMTLPFPFIYENFYWILRKDNRSVRLVLTKAVHEPWPIEFHSINKWSVENFQPYTGRQLDEYLEKKNRADSLAKFRELIRSIFVEAAKGNGPIKLALQGRNSKPDWFVRLYLPVLKSPLEVPLLLLSVLDFKAHGEEGHYPLFTHLITIPSTREAVLLRYLFRLNSTRITPASIQQTYPWLPTFISPIHLHSNRIPTGHNY